MNDDLLFLIFFFVGIGLIIFIVAELHLRTCVECQRLYGPGLLKPKQDNEG